MKRTREEWEQIVAELATSGQDVREFAAQRGINQRTLSWWRWRIGTDRRATPSPNTKTKSFLPVVVCEPTRSIALWDDVEVGLPNGVRLRLSGVTSVGLREVVTIVGAS